MPFKIFVTNITFVTLASLVTDFSGRSNLDWKKLSA
jgi:hypothetical protein